MGRGLPTLTPNYWVGTEECGGPAGRPSQSEGASHPGRNLHQRKNNLLVRNPYNILEEDCGRLPRTRRPYYDGEKYDDDDYYDESAKEEQPQEPATAKDFKKDNPKMVTI